MIELFRKLRDLLDRRERRNALLLLLLMFIQGLVETAGVASIFPFIALLSNPELIHSNSYLAATYNALGFGDQTSFLIFLGIFALVLILSRIGVTALTSYATARYTHLRSFTLSTRLLEGYLNRPYSWFLNRHSVDLGKTMLSEVDEVVKSSLMRAFGLVAQVIVASCLISLVIVVQPLVTLTAILLVGGAYALAYRVLGPYLSKFGKDRFRSNRERFQLAHEVLGAIKEVKIRGLEHPYLQRFTEVSYLHARMKATNVVVSDLPRYFLEALTSAGIVTIVLILLVEAKGDLSNVLPIIVLYAFATLRLMPKVQTIYANLVSIRFNSAALDAIHADMMEGRAPALKGSRRRLPMEDSLELCGVTFAYARDGRPALVDISLTIAANATVGFVGKTGAGKTTLIDVIIGLLEPQHGEVMVDGAILKGNNVRDWQMNIGYVPQQIFLANDSVAANIAFGVPPHKINMHSVERVSRMAELHDFVTQELPQGYATMVGERGIRLSGGQRQRVGIARALYDDPDVLVLDEATSALDNLTETAVMDAIRNLAHRKTILIIAHRLSTIQACDKLFLLEQGSLVASGTYDDLLKTHPGFRRLAIKHRTGSSLFPAPI